MPDDLSTWAASLGADGWSAVALALAALINSIAYVLRRRADASAQLVQSLLARVRDREARVNELEASRRASERRADVLVEENEALRDAIDTGRVIPERVRIVPRDPTGGHKTLTQELLAERAHRDAGET